jgi:hypothetical protein
VYESYLSEIDEELKAINPKFNPTSRYIMGLELSGEEVHELNRYFAYGRDKTFDEKTTWLDAWLKQLDCERPQEYVEKMVAAFDDPSAYVNKPDEKYD